MRDGDLFRVDAIRDGLKNLHELYCRLGYLNFTPVPNVQIDDSSSTISVLFDLDEGEKFFYGELVVDGEESVSGARRKLVAAWEAYKDDDGVVTIIKRDLLAEAAAHYDSGLMDYDRVENCQPS